MSHDYNPLPAITAASPRQKIIGIVVLALLTVLLVIRIGAGADDSRLTRQAHPISVITVEMQDHYTRERSFTGRATAAQVSKLGFELGGTVSTVSVDDGDMVTKGRALASLDTARLNAQKNQLLAKHDELASNLAFADRNYARAKKTHKQGHISDQQLDSARNAYDSIKASSKALDANIEAVDVELDKSTLTAPFDGVVNRRLIDEGTVVSAGMPLFEIIASGQVEAKIGVTDDIAEALKAGTNFRLIDGRYDAVTGTFHNVVSSIRSETRTRMATFMLDEGAASDGELITLLIDNDVTMRGTWLPIRALTADVRGLWRVYKISDIEGEKRVRFENVQLLHTSGEMAYVTGSIKDGDQIVSGGVDRLALNQLVTVVQDTTASSQ